MVYDITCLLDRHCYQHFRGICSFHFRIEAKWQQVPRKWG